MIGRVLLGLGSVFGVRLAVTLMGMVTAHMSVFKFYYQSPQWVDAALRASAASAASGGAILFILMKRLRAADSLPGGAGIRGESDFDPQSRENSSKSEAERF
jgi:hypothetical protein